MFRRVCSLSPLIAAAALASMTSACVKQRTVTTQGGRVVSQGPVVTAPITGRTIRSHEDRMKASQQRAGERR